MDGNQIQPQIKCSRLKNATAAAATATVAVCDTIDIVIDWFANIFVHLFLGYCLGDCSNRKDNNWLIYVKFSYIFLKIPFIKKAVDSLRHLYRELK